MNKKLDSVESIVTIDWLKKYIEETQKYDACDWYLALSSRKNVHDYIVSLYQNPKGYLSPQGHKNFRSPLITEQLNRSPRPIWKAFLDGIEQELNTTIQFLGEYPTPDKHASTLSFSAFPFNTCSVETFENGPVKVRVFMSDGHYRKYITAPDSTFELMSLLNDDIYFEWCEKNTNEPEAIRQIPSLVEKIKNGEILSFTEERATFSLPKESNFSVWSQCMATPSHSVKTVTAGYAFMYLNKLMLSTDNASAQSKKPFEEKIFWSENSQEKTILAEINLMKSDKEIIQDFSRWLVQTRQRLEIPFPPKKQIVRNPVQKTTDELTQTLALAYIDFKILELHYREKKPESFFLELARQLSGPDKICNFNATDEEKIKDKIKNIVRKAMSADFMKQLSEQITPPSVHN